MMVIDQNMWEQVKVIFNVNFETLSSLIKSAFFGVWTLWLTYYLSFSSQNCFCRSIHYIMFSFTIWCREFGQFKFHILLVSSFSGHSVLVSLLFVLLNLFQFAVIGHFVPTVYPVLCVLPYSVYA
jgi:hypothetical protein